MTEMIEKVARAMAIADGLNPDNPAHVSYPGAVPFGVVWHDKYAAKARAALQAMREPSPQMLRAFYEAAHPAHETPAGGFTRWATWEEAKPHRETDLRKGFAAAIDDALSQSPREG